MPVRDETEYDPDAAQMARLAVVSAIAEALGSRRRRRLIARLEAIAADWERQAGAEPLHGGPARAAVIKAQGRAAAQWLRPALTALAGLFPAG